MTLHRLGCVAVGLLALFLATAHAGAGSQRGGTRGGTRGTPAGRGAEYYLTPESIPIVNEVRPPASLEELCWGADLIAEVVVAEWYDSRGGLETDSILHVSRVLVGQSPSSHIVVPQNGFHGRDESGQVTTHYNLLDTGERYIAFLIEPSGPDTRPAREGAQRYFLQGALFRLTDANIVNVNPKLPAGLLRFQGMSIEPVRSEILSIAKEMASGPGVAVKGKGTLPSDLQPKGIRVAARLRDKVVQETDMNPDGTFEFQKLKPGPYTIALVASPDMAVTAAPVAVRVANRDVSNVSLRIISTAFPGAPR